MTLVGVGRLNCGIVLGLILCRIRLVGLRLIHNVRWVCLIYLRRMVSMLRRWELVWHLRRVIMLRMRMLIFMVWVTRGVRLMVIGYVITWLRLLNKWDMTWEMTLKIFSTWRLVCTVLAIWLNGIGRWTLRTRTVYMMLGSDAPVG